MQNFNRFYLENIFADDFRNFCFGFVIRFGCINSLCCIKEQGLTKWLQKAPEIKQRYFSGKMALGKGPQLGTDRD